MTEGLRRFHQSAQPHFVTMSCYHRQPRFSNTATCHLFLHCLEEMRCRFSMRIYGHVVMPEHVHLLVSEPGPSPQPRPRHPGRRPPLPETLFHKTSSRTNRRNRFVWQKRNRNVRDEDEFQVKLRTGNWELGTALEIESQWTASDRETKISGERPRLFLSPG